MITMTTIINAHPEKIHYLKKMVFKKEKEKIIPENKKGNTKRDKGTHTLTHIHIYIHTYAYTHIYIYNKGKQL